jgi:hypothetical protein
MRKRTRNVCKRKVRKVLIEMIWEVLTCSSPLSLAVVFLAACLDFQAAVAADFSVTTPNDQYAYLINGLDNNPTITLIRGKTYTFAINTDPNHPFAIGTAIGFPAPPGVSGNATSSGTITFNVPSNATDCVYYCVIHDFAGQIHMVDSPKPPQVNIVGLSVDTNLILTTVQATTNGFSFLPEGNINLATTNWFALTVRSNRFANGTNEIFCGKPPGTNMFLRVRIQ